mmetsp:Transcript_22021/g.37276  ORF Transcript_22021/g.37276 Transcript_22021/m.37276 type:complete len:3228 (-) Transcript_22021:12-9695(-)
MQIFKKRMSVHRTSRNLRSLWDEYALQITAEGLERDSSRLLALSSFMESVFDVGQPLEPTSLENFNFDDTTVVITGLLNMARRASIQLLTDESCKEEVDRATLAEALRKALLVARLCLKKCPDRDNINQVPHIVSLVLAVLENVASPDDKILSLQILGYILQYEESKLELRRLGGLRLLCSLAPAPELRRQIVATLRLYLTPSCTSYTGAAGLVSSSMDDRNSKSLPQSRSTATMESCHNYSSADLLQTTSDSFSQHGSSHSGGGSSCQKLDCGSSLPTTWPPLQPPTIFSVGFGHDSRDTPQTEHLPAGGTGQGAHSPHHPSASLAAKGVNMAVNAVNEILRLTPMASATWLQGNLSHEVVDPQLAESSSFAEASAAYYGGLDLTAPPSWRDHECRRLRELVTNMRLQESTANNRSGDKISTEDTSPFSYMFAQDSATSPDVVTMIISFLQAAVADSSDDATIDSCIDAPTVFEDQESLLQCVTNLLLYHEAAKECFLELQGYDALRNVIGVIADRKGCGDFSFSHEQETAPSTDELRHPDNDNKCVRDESNEANVVTLLLSLVFGRQLNSNDIERIGDVSYTEAVHLDLLVKNMYALDIMVRMVESDNTRLVMVGMRCLEQLLRLSPLAVMALKESNGVVALGLCVVKYSSIESLLSENNAPVGGEDDFDICRNASNVLMKVAVLDSDVNMNVLAFFTFLLHENAFCQHNLISAHTAQSSTPKCSNCETEVAVFECTDGGCIREDMFHLCLDCDKVFHKSALKRNHIRLPAIEFFSTAPLLDSMGRDFRTAVAQSHNSADAPNKSTFVTDEELDDMLPCNSDLLAHTSCLLLSHIASILNDRQVKMLENPGEVLDAVLRIFRYNMIVISKSGSQTGDDLHLDVDMQQSVLKHAADSFFESRFALGLLQRKIPLTVRLRRGESMEPPEHVQHKAQRIFLSLCLQIIARYFVSETVPTYLAGDGQDLGDSRAYDEVFCAPNTCSRCNMISRVRYFRAIGTEALLVLVVVSNNSSLLLTESDKQFALWTLREVCVAAYSVDSSEGSGLMIWWGWLVHCPIIRESKSSESSRKAKAKDSKGTQKRQQAWKQTLTASIENNYPGIALPPIEQRHVCGQIRLFVLQELRLLLGGEDWDPVLVAGAVGVPSKLCRITCPPPSLSSFTSSASSKVGGDDDNLGERPLVYFRIPTSKQIVQAPMVSAGVLHGLIDIVFGDLCHPEIHRGLQSLQRRGDHSSTLHDLDIEEWWSGFNALHSLVAKCSVAKQAVDDYFGVVACTKHLLSLIQFCCSGPNLARLGRSLTDFVTELSIHGSICHLKRPFMQWSKTSVVRHHTQAQSSSFAERFVAPFSIHTNANGWALDNLSCVYFVRMSCCHQISLCLRPRPVFLHPSSYDHGNEHVRSTSRSNSNCIESRSSFKIDQQGAPSAYGDRGGDFSDIFLDDRSSTGRGSFTLHSASHLSLHAISRVYSTNSLHLTPTPSVAADTTHTFEEYGVGYGCTKAHIASQAASNKGAGEELGDYSGTFIPLSSALGWGLAHRRNIILRIVYDTLLLRCDALAADDTQSGSSGPQSLDLLTSLRKQSIEQYMQSFLSVDETGASGLPKGGESSARGTNPDVSISPTCVFRALHLVVNMFSLCLVLHDDSGEVQGNILRSLSHLINGNPLNADMIHRTSLTLNLSRFVFSHNNSYFPRAAICHILSQLFSFKVTPLVFNCLVDTASSVAGVRMTERPMLLIPTKGVSQRIDVETDLDDVGCQILYLLGRAVEHPEVTAYAHFDHACPFLSRAVLSPISIPPSPQVGLSAFVWLRLGNLSDSPNATLLQLSMDHPKRHDHTTVVSSEDSDKDRTSSGAAHSIDFYFRVVHQTGISHSPNGGKFTESTFHPPDFSSVASGTSAGAAMEEVQRSYVQLCASYGESRSVLWKAENPQTTSDSNIAPTSGLDGEIVSSLVKYSAPDVIIDFEWHEMGDWHSLFLSLSSEGVNCVIDGVPRKALYWTALGYVDADEAPPNIRYPELSHGQVLQPVLGGIIHEQYAYMDSMQNLKILAEQCNAGLHEAEVGVAESEMRLKREVDLLQSYAELVRGMSGYVGGLLLMGGIPDETAILSAHSQGLQNTDMAHLFTSHKPLCSFLPSRFGGASTKKEYAPRSRGFHTVAVSDHVDIEAAASSWQLEQHQHGRGRQNSTGEECSRGSSSRVSRSLSPNNSRYHHMTSALQGDVNRASSNHHVVHARAHDLDPPQSLVSDILTMLAGPVSTRIRANSKSNNDMFIEGSVLIRNACDISDEICSFAKGGLRVWYPLLIMDGPRQVATLRIIASLVASSSSVYNEFDVMAMSNVILYSLYVTPLLASEASLQVLFDLTTQALSPQAAATSHLPIKHESIHRVEFLKLTVQIAAASPCNIQLSMCTVEWLLGLCEDSLDNIGKVLEATGVVPFLLMLSLWLKCEDMQLVETEDRETLEGGGVAEYMIRMPFATLTVDEKAHILSSSKGVFNDSIYSDQPKKLAKLQVTVARFLKLLITGSNGELPSIRVAAAAQSPTGFGVQHLQSLLNFIAFSMEVSLSESSDIGASSTGHGRRRRSHGSSSDFISASTDANWTSFFVASTRVAPQSTILRACQLALDCIIYPSEGPLGATIITMLRSALPGYELWYMIMNLLNCRDVAIKARALHLLGFCLSTLDGQIDQRLVLQFEKIGGFRFIAEAFSGFSGDSEVILRELLSLFFWRSGSRGMFAYSKCISPTGVAPHSRTDTKTTFDERRGTTESKNNNRDAAGGSSGIFSMFNWMSKPDKTEEGSVSGPQGSAPIPMVDSQQKGAGYGIDDDYSSGVAASNNSSNLASSHRERDNDDFTAFRSIITDNTATGNEMSLPPVHQSLPSDSKSEGIRSAPPRIETIALPQLFEAILQVLGNEIFPERILNTVAAIEQALVFPAGLAVRDLDDVANEALQSTIAHNMEALTGEKMPDWLLWIYNDLVTFKRRDIQEMLQDSNCLSMSEGESGVESGDDSVDTERKLAGGRPRPSPSSPVSMHHTHSLLNRFADPLLGLVQVVLTIDMVKKPSSSRKLYDILKLPVPEARDEQLTILLDLLHSVNFHQQYNTDYNTCMNLLRNLSAFLEKVLMKCEISLEFCIQSVHTLDSLVYRAPPEVRNKVKDTLLPEVRNAYVTYCLVQRAESVWPRITALAEMHSSVLNLILSGETRSIYDHQVFLLLLELFLQASTLNIEDDEGALDSSNCRS